MIPNFSAVVFIFVWICTIVGLWELGANLGTLTVFSVVAITFIVNDDNDDDDE